MNYLVVLLLFSLNFVFCKRFVEAQSNELVAVFVPNKISFKVNSSKCFDISLRGIAPGGENDHLNRSASLLLLNADENDHTEADASKQFEFDQDWKAKHCVYSDIAGRFGYYVQLAYNKSAKVEGSLTVHVYHQRGAEIFSTIIGWVNFFLWSISFYPQIILNHRRKSVVGLSFDFTVINLAGFLPFAIFNCLFYFPGTVQSEYFRQYPHKQIPVEPNDVAFSVHAAILSAITFLQCFIFERGDQHVTMYGYAFLACSSGTILLMGILYGTNVVNLLQFIYVFSYVKLASTAVKYIPQVYFNYRRKSTVGWSIGAIIMDSVGGVCSFLQQIIIALNFDSWSVLYGNVVKFLLGISSLVFDFIFILQHYVLYRKPKKKSEQQ